MTGPRCAIRAARRRDLGRGPRGARRDAARPHPDPVGQSARPRPPDGELAAARHIAGPPRGRLRPEIVEPVPGRGSVDARLRGDGPAASPLLLLSHLDVVPAPPDRWTHDPFEADLADGYIYGRGAVDMKGMVAMELGSSALLAAEARAAGLDPARDPIPGLRRDVLFTCTADEEAGGDAGAKWIAEHRPEWLRPPAPSTSAAASRRRSRASASIRSRSRRRAMPPTGSHVRGTWGHGSMPREDNAAVLAAAIVGRLAGPGPVR